MTDKNDENAENAQKNDGNNEDNLTNDTKDISVKSTLSQSQVDEIVKTRLARQKKELDGQLLTVNTQLEEKSLLVDTYEKYFNEIISKQIGDVPDAIKTIFEKLSLTDKLDWLSKYSQSTEMKGLEKQVIPTSPKSNDKGENNFKPNTKNVFKI